MSGKYRLLLAFWGILFLASSLIVAISVVPLGGEIGGLFPKFILSEGGLELESKPGGDDIPVDVVQDWWSLVLAAVSAFISAAGFIATTYFAVRSDHRQSALTELQIQQLSNEIERQKLEIDRLKREQRERE